MGTLLMLIVGGLLGLLLLIAACLVVGSFGAVWFLRVYGVYTEYV